MNRLPLRAILPVTQNCRCSLHDRISVSRLDAIFTTGAPLSAVRATVFPDGIKKRIKSGEVRADIRGINVKLISETE
jgi:hypothetical protein